MAIQQGRIRKANTRWRTIWGYLRHQKYPAEWSVCTSVHNRKENSKPFIQVRRFFFGNSCGLFNNHIGMDLLLCHVPIKVTCQSGRNLNRDSNRLEEFEARHHNRSKILSRMSGLQRFVTSRLWKTGPFGRARMFTRSPCTTSKIDESPHQK